MCARLMIDYVPLRFSFPHIYRARKSLETLTSLLELDTVVLFSVPRFGSRSTSALLVALAQLTYQIKLLFNTKKYVPRSSHSNEDFSVLTLIMFSLITTQGLLCLIDLCILIILLTSDRGSVQLSMILRQNV